MKRIILIILTFLPLLLVSEVTKTDTTTAKAQTPKKRLFELNEVRVIAEKPHEAVGSVEVKHYRKEEPHEETNISEAVEDISGVTINQAGKSGAELSIRGFDSKTVKIMLDGRPVDGGYFGNLDLNTIPVSEIKEIQVLKGPVSSLYGSDTMGGVINIITREPDNNTSMKIGLLAKRNNTNKIYLSASKSYENYDYWLYGSRYNTEGFILSEDFEPTVHENGSVRNHMKYEQFDFQSKFNFTLFDFHTIGFQAGYTFMGEKEIPCSIFENKKRVFTDLIRYQLSTLGSFQLKYNLVTNFNMYLDHYEDSYAEYNYNSGTFVMGSSWPSTIKSNTYGILNSFDWDTSDVTKLQFGNRFEVRSYNRKDNGSYSSWTGYKSYNNNSFMQLEYKHNEFLFVLGSGLTMFSHEKNSDLAFSFEPSASLTYETRDFWKFSVAYSRNTRYPTLHQLFSSSSGNIDLKEQEANKYEFNTKIPLSNFNIPVVLTSSIFYNDISNLIYKAPITDDYTNFEKAESQGFEIGVKASQFWEHDFNYSFITYKEAESAELLSVPENEFAYKASSNLYKGIHGSYKISWIDEREFAEGSLKGTMESYWLHSFSLSKKINRIKLLFSLENIFDKNYMEKYGYPAPGRDFTFSMEMGF